MDYKSRPDPLLVTVPIAFARIGAGRTKGYELIRRKLLDARKIGRKTVITTESLERFAASLPRLHGDDGEAL